VIEEYFRFVVASEDAAIELKKMRHDLTAIEERLGQEHLMSYRDVESDCFSGANRPEEMDRSGMQTLLRANFKRAQEAARVIEEYAKLAGKEAAEASEGAKMIRFSLYRMEQLYSTM